MTDEDSIPDHILHQPCTDRDPSMRMLMVDVSRRTKVRFKMLGRCLDVDESDLDAIEEENTGPNSTQERKYQVMLKWVNTHGQRATVEALIRALVVAGDTQAVELVRNKVDPREDVMRAVAGDPSYIANTPPTSGPIKSLPSPFGSTTPSCTASGISTPARITSSGLLYQLGQAESLYHAFGKLSLGTSPTAVVGGVVAQPSSTPADPVTLPTGRFGPPVSDMSDRACPSDLPSMAAAETSSASDMVDLEAVRPGLQRPRTLPVRSPHLPFSVQVTRENPTPFDSMPRCCHGIGKWLQQQMEEEMRKSYSQIKSFSREYMVLQSEMNTLSFENEYYKENIRVQKETIRKLAIGSCHVENAKLRTELELNEKLLSLICQCLHISKQDILRACDLETMSSELGAMIKLAADQGKDIPQTVLSLRAECNRLLLQKIELEGKLDDFITLFSKQQQELDAVMEEKKELVDASQESHIALQRLQEEVYLSRKFWVDKNKDLEARVATLENLNKDLLEENEKLLQQNRKLKENRFVPSKEVLSGYCRSLSDGSYHVAAMDRPITFRTVLSLDSGDSEKERHKFKKECSPPCSEQISQSASNCCQESSPDEALHRQVTKKMVMLITGIEDGRNQLAVRVQELREKIDQMKDGN